MKFVCSCLSILERRISQSSAFRLESSRNLAGASTNRPDRPTIVQLHTTHGYEMRNQYFMGQWAEASTTLVHATAKE